MPDIDVMGYMPDPHEQIESTPTVRGTSLWFQGTGTESGQTFAVNSINALKMAGQVTYLTGRIHQHIAEAMVDEMGPEGCGEVARAADNPNDERWHWETYRRPKN